MGADKSREYYFHEWKNWGLPGIVAGRIVDATRGVISGVGERHAPHDVEILEKQQAVSADVGERALVGAVQE